MIHISKLTGGKMSECRNILLLNTILAILVRIIGVKHIISSVYTRRTKNLISYSYSGREHFPFIFFSPALFWLINMKLLFYSPQKIKLSKIWTQKRPISFGFQNDNNNETSKMLSAISKYVGIYLLWIQFVVFEVKYFLNYHLL